MAKPARIPSYLLSLAGEYRVCSELNKRGIFATVTYGNYKGVDVYAISDRKARALKIEVKTSQRENFVTRITQKRLCEEGKAHAPDFCRCHASRARRRRQARRHARCALKARHDVLGTRALHAPGLARCAAGQGSA